MKGIKIPREDTITECFESFISDKISNGVVDKTINTYRNHFQAISKHLFINKDITLLSKKDLDDMIVSMRESGLSPHSIKSYTTTLSVFLNWCNKKGITSLTCKIFKCEESVKDTYSKEELARLLKKPNMKTCQFYEYRDWVIVNFLVNCGCRAATLRNIQIKDVDLENSLVFARHTKSKRPLSIPLCSEMKNILREYMKIRKGERADYLFCSSTGEMLSESALRRTIFNYNRRRGVNKTSLHMFRHTFAKMFLLDCGGDAFRLQKLLGHSTLDMTKHYCTIFDSEIATNYDDLSPLEKIRQQNKKITM